MPTRRRCLILFTLLLVGGTGLRIRANGSDLRLLDAVKRRDQKAFAVLLRSKVDINAATADGVTPLAWAVHLAEREMAEALLRAGADVNTADDYGETPLTLACANGDGVLVQRLLAAGAKVDVARWDGETTVMLAAGAGSLVAVTALVSHGADVNVGEPDGGQTALMWAAAERHTDVVRGLLKLGANVNAMSRAGFTPLVFAVIADDGGSTQALLTAGADPNYSLPSGGTPLIVALSYHSTAAATALLEGGARTTVRDAKSGMTPLHTAAQGGNVTIVKALLARKADPNVRTPKATAERGPRGGGGGARAPGPGELTPLMLAAKGDHQDVIRALLGSGADPSLRAQDGSTLLMAAAGGARLATFTFAYELDPHLDIVTITNATVMHAAAELGGRTQAEVCEVIQFLADRGAALDELDAAGRTPLVVADRLPVDRAVDLLTKLITERGGKPKVASVR
jgi:ankyrin repeat protein